MNDKAGVINWTRPMLARFKKEYEAQKSAGKGRDETFAFEHHTFVMGYAHYLILYLDLMFGV